MYGDLMKTTASAKFTVTTQMFKHGDVDEAAYAAFVAKTIKSNKRAVAKGRGVWAGKTDADAIEAAEQYCRCYRHQFRTLIPVQTKAEALTF